jgi:hypothetical protein
MKIMLTIASSLKMTTHYLDGNAPQRERLEHRNEHLLYFAKKME